MSSTALDGRRASWSTAWRWLISSPGITTVLTVAIATWVTAEAGLFALVNGIVTGGMWALVAVGLSLVFGVMNIANFAHGEFYMVGAMTGYFVFTPLAEYLLRHPAPVLSAIAPILTFFIAGIVGGVVGVAAELLIFRPLRHRTKESWVMNCFLLTLGLSTILQNTALLAVGSDTKGIFRYWEIAPIQFLDVSISFDRLAALAIAVICIVGLWLMLKRTQTGRAIRAVSQDETGALLVGIDLDRIQLLTIALSAALAAVAGAALLFIFPATPTVGTKPLFTAWFVLVIVGMGNVPGAIVGGFIVAFVQSAVSFFIGPAWEEVVPVAILVLILLVKPSGLFGSVVKGIQEQ